VGRELYGPFQIPSFYSPTRRFITIEHKPYYSPNQIYGLIILAIQLALKTHRMAIRVTGWTYVHGPNKKAEVFHSLYDADHLLKTWNITLLESRYWDGLKRMNPDQGIDPTGSSKTLEVSSTKMLEEYQTQEDRNALDLQLNILDDDVLKDIMRDYEDKDLLAPYLSLLCRNYLSSRPRCSATCQGSG
jgi:hypothetical protein